MWRWILYVAIASFLASQVMAGDPRVPQKSQQTELFREMSREFDWSDRKLTKDHFFMSQTEMTRVYANGKKESAGIFQLFLQATPPRKKGDTECDWSCRKFAIAKGAGKIRTIPALEKFSYRLTLGIDDKNQVFGIDHDRFSTLKDSVGDTLQMADPYLVYNTFIDFHGFFNVPILDDKQKLSRLGDATVAKNRPEIPVHLGQFFEKGSVYRLGAMRRRFDGFGLVEQKLCAVIAFDSGDSSFMMKIVPFKGVKLVTEGYSRFEGTIFVDLESKWPVKCYWKEVIISKTKNGEKIVPNGEEYMVRTGLIVGLSKDEFERRLKKDE